MLSAANARFWILLGIFWIASLPIRPLFDPDEGRYAEIPREMVASGDWVTPKLNDLKYFEKPPLQYWATAALYSVLGVHEWTGRLWAAALAFLCIPLVYAFSRGMGYTPETSLVAASLLAINPYFVITGQINLLDQGFTFFLSAAVFSFVLSQREHLRPQRSRSWMLLTWAALGFAVLSKGIVALVLAGGSLTLYMLVARDPAPLRRLHLIPGVLVLLVITVPWFVLVQDRNPEFFQFFFIREHFARFLTTIHDRTQPFWYFLPILLIALLPVVGNWRRWKLKDIESNGEGATFRPQLFLILWCTFVVVLFSFSQSKLAPYILPAMPALSALLAGVTHAQPSAFGRAKWASIALLLVIAVGLVIAGYQRTGDVSKPAVSWALIVAATCLIYVIAEKIRPHGDISKRWSSLAVLSVACYQILSLCYAASIPARSAKGLVAQLDENQRRSATLYSVGQYRHTLSFYLQRPVEVYAFVGELEFGLTQAGLVSKERTRERFLERWSLETHAIAFIEPKTYAALSIAGLPGKVIARDSRSFVVSRS